VRFSLIYDDVQAALAASVDSNNVEKPSRGRDSDSDVDISNEKADRELTQPAERLRLVRPQK
jgi:hypothetical protein